MEIPRFVYAGILSGLLVSAEACTFRDPVAETINGSGQKIAKHFNEKTLVPNKPDQVLVSRMRESVDLMRGLSRKPGGFRTSIDKASSVVLEREKIDPATYSCINEVAAATRLPLTKLQQATDEEGAYLLRMVVDAGMTIAHRNGVKPTPCPYLRENS